MIHDASPDDTYEVATDDSLASDSRIEVRPDTWNKGHIATYNEGIEMGNWPITFCCFVAGFSRPCPEPLP